jgi:hypothetical protein
LILEKSQKYNEQNYRWLDNKKIKFTGNTYS